MRFKKQIVLIGLGALAAVGAAVSCSSGEKAPSGRLAVGTGVTLPAGSVLPYSVKFPAGAVFRAGYIANGSYTAATTLQAETALPAGTVLLGPVVIPAGATFPEGTLLPGGRIYAAPGETTTIKLGAVVIPEATVDEASRLPGGTLVNGSLKKLASPLTFPAGTDFANGYKLPSGSMASKALPDAFPITAVAETTLPAGTLLLGGGFVQPEKIFSLAAGTKLMGGLALPHDVALPAGGASLPAGTIFPEGFTSPKGFTLTKDAIIPKGTFLSKGYLKLEGGAYTYVATAGNLTEALSLPAGSVLLGYVVFPAGTSLSSPFPAPGGGKLSRDENIGFSGPLGAYIPVSAAIATASDLPAGTLLYAPREALTQDVTLPAGTVFHGGYWRAADATYVEPFTATTSVTLKAGDKVLGTIEIGSSFSVAAGFSFPGQMVVPSCGTTQPAGTGLTLPAGTFVEAGITRAAGNVAPGTTLSADTLVSADDSFYTPVQIGSPLAGATRDTAQISWSTNIHAVEEVRYTTNAALAEGDWGDCTKVTCVKGCQTSTCGTSHSLNLPDMTPDTRYYFRIYASAAGSCSATSQDKTATLSFTTAPQCAGDFALVSVSNEEPLETGNFGKGASVAGIADFASRLFFSSSNETFSGPRMYKTDTTYTSVTTQPFTLSNSSFNETGLMKAARFSGTDKLFVAFNNTNQAFHFYMTDGSEDGSGNLNMTGIVNRTGNGLDTSGFDDGNNKYVSAMLGGDGYIYVGTEHANANGEGKLYVATSLAGTTAAQIADNFADAGGAGDIISGYADVVAGINRISALAEFKCDGSTTNLIVGARNNSGGAKLFKTGVGNRKVPVWSTVNTGLAAANTDITTLLASRDGTTLFLGTHNNSGAQIWKTGDCTTFTKVVDFADGTGLGGTADATNKAITFLEENGTTAKALYFGTENATDGFEIWRSQGGLTTATAFAQAGVDTGTCSAAKAANGFGAATAAAGKFVTVRQGVSANGGKRLFVATQSAAGIAGGRVRVYRVDDQ